MHNVPSTSKWAHNNGSPAIVKPDADWILLTAVDFIDTFFKKCKIHGAFFSRGKELGVLRIANLACLRLQALVGSNWTVESRGTRHASRATPIVFK